MSFQDRRKSSALAVMLLLACGLRMHAQQGPQGLDVAVTYNAAHSLQAGTLNRFWQQDGSIELGATAWKGFGAVANVTGLHAASVGTGGVPLSLVTATFGPRYRWHDGRKLVLYGQSLFGIANAFHTLVPTNTGGDTSANSMALQLEGGADLRLSRHFALRMVDAGWVRTYLPNGTDNIQNNLRLGAGAVLHFGH